MEKVKEKVELFPQEGGWHYIKIPKTITKKYSEKSIRCLVPVIAQVNESKWKTLPRRDGTHFIALKAKIRKKEHINLSDKIKIKFEIDLNR